MSGVPHTPDGAWVRRNLRRSTVPATESMWKVAPSVVTKDAPYGPANGTWLGPQVSVPLSLNVPGYGPAAAPVTANVIGPLPSALHRTWKFFVDGWAGMHTPKKQMSFGH